ncbi:PadR family transcriptional regulator [Mycoplasmatota bacterium]|nr:PadR family transcriptional regulator [Mycoplasmatota bacterium]
MEENQVLENLIVELRRGTQIIMVLHELKEQAYGYSLLQKLSDRNVQIEAGTLYPLLRRLEKQNLLESSWDTTESRPRKFYILSEFGYEVLSDLKSAWKLINDELSSVFEEEE